MPAGSGGGCSAAEAVGGCREMFILFGVSGLDVSVPCWCDGVRNDCVCVSVYVME